MDVLIDPQKSGALLALAASVAKEKSPLAFLAGLALETDGDGAVKAAATDAEVAVVALLPAQVRRPGRACVNARSLMEVVRRAEGRAVALSARDDGRIDCALGQSRYRLGLISADEMPSITLPEKARLLSLPAAQLAAMIADVRPAAGADAGRYILDSVLLERKGSAFSVVATDGRRLAVREAALPQAGKDFSFPVPLTAVRALEKALDAAEEDAEVSIFFDGDKMGFEAGAVRVAARALEGNYPAWRDAVPRDAEAAFFTAGADKLGGAVDGLVRVVPDPAEIRLERRGESSVLLTAEGRLNAGEEVVETASPPDPFPAVRVNGRYLLDAVLPARGKLVRVGIIRADRPVLVRSMDDAGYRAVIMPLLPPKDGQAPAVREVTSKK